MMIMKPFNNRPSSIVVPHGMSNICGVQMKILYFARPSCLKGVF